MSEKLKLKCKVISTSSNDNGEGSPNNMLNNNETSYWVSSRFCRYPQYIFIKFNYPTILSQVKILLHEYKIPSKINFYTFCPDSQYDYLISDLIKQPMIHIGYVMLNTNEKSNYKARELKTIMLDNIRCYYMKLELHSNHVNRFNNFYQVAIVSLQFYGEILTGGIDSFNPDGYDEFNMDVANVPKGISDIPDDKLQEICGEKLEQINECIKIARDKEDYETCKKLYKDVQKVKAMAKKVLLKEIEKKQAVANEDYDTASQLKQNINDLKLQINRMQIELPNVNVNKNNENEIIEEKIENNDISEMNNNNIVDSNIHNKSLSIDNPNQNNLSSFSYGIPNNKYHQDELKNYDDIVPPGIAKRSSQNLNINDISTYFNINNQSFDTNDLPLQPDSVELEPLNLQLAQQFPTLHPLLLTDDCFRKLTSKSLYYKDQGFSLLHQYLPSILSEPKHTITIQRELSSLLSLFFDEKHQNTIVNTLSLAIDIITCIDSQKETNPKLKTKYIITNHIIALVLDYLNDGSSKIRQKSMELYTLILLQEDLDYYDLLTKLLEKDIYDKSYSASYSIKGTINKLSIVRSLIKEIEKGNDVIPGKEDVSFRFLVYYIIVNMGHAKQEVKQIARGLFKMVNEICSMEFVKKMLGYVDRRAFPLLVKDVPEVKEYVEDIKKEDKKNGGIVEEIPKEILRKKKEEDEENENEKEVNDNDKDNENDNKEDES